MDIYVGNLPYGTDEETLNRIFSQYGTVDKVNIIINRATGRSKGYAFVMMHNDDEAQRAIEALDGSDIEGRPAKINQSRPREERRPRESRDDRGFNKNFRKRRYSD